MPWGMPYLLGPEGQQLDQSEGRTGLPEGPQGEGAGAWVRPHWPAPPPHPEGHRPHGHSPRAKQGQVVERIARPLANAPLCLRSHLASRRACAPARRAPHLPV